MVFSYSIRKINLFLVWNFKYFQVDLLKRILNYISEILYEKNSFCGNFEGVGSNKSFYLNWNWKSVFSYFVAMVKDTRALLFESLMLQFKFEIENSILKCSCFKIWKKYNVYEICSGLKEGLWDNNCVTVIFTKKFET